LSCIYEGDAADVLRCLSRYEFRVRFEPLANPALVSPPSLLGDGTIGAELTCHPGTWSGEPEITFAWLRDAAEIADATSGTYAPGPEDDGHRIACRVTASNSFGTVVATTEEIAVVYRAPTATVALIEEVFDQGSGLQAVDASVAFNGEALVYAIEGLGAEVDASTGVVTIATDEATSARELIVTARNSGGEAGVTILVTVEAENDDTPDHLPRVAFAGPQLVQFIAEEGTVGDPGFVVVDRSAEPSWQPDPFDRYGGLGRLAGTEGNFSGDAHTSAPQLFFPWETFEADPLSPAFATVDNGAANLCLADDPAKWRAMIDDKPAAVIAVHRKTVPIKTVEVSIRTYASRRRHLVTLTLDRPVPLGARVTVAPPSGAEAEAERRPDVISEAIHVCHAGYPLGGPKKGYVGLWLGHSADGRDGSTDGALSAATRWSLVRAADGTTVANGTLRLAKAASDSHQASVNYNGCDIYEADFTAHADAGSYRLEVEGVGASPVFAIEAQPYAEALRLAARWYFHQRSGCAVEEPHGEGRTRPRNGHPADGLAVTRTEVKLGRYSEGFVAGNSVFPALVSGAVAPAPGGAGLVPADALDAPERWQPLPAQFLVGGGTLTITGSGYRVGDLVLDDVTTPGTGYRLVVRVSALSAAGSGLRAKLTGAAPSMEAVPLTLGENVIELLPQAGYRRIQIDAMSSTTATITAIGLELGAGSGGTDTVQNAWGGWHDAGDWDRRIQHMDVVYTMAQMVESFPAVRGLDANIPESGRSFADPAVAAAKKNPGDTGDGKTVLPDLIHEALWGISLWRRTQNPSTGAIIGGVEYSLDGIAGSVSWNPLQRAYAYAEEEWCAYQFAMAAAKLGHVVGTVCGDRVLGDALIAEAEAAWSWAEGVLDTGIDEHNTFSNPDIARARVPAAAVLYRANGNAGARAVFESYCAFGPIGSTGLPRAGDSLGTNRGDYALQAWDYVRAGEEGRAVDAALAAAIVSWSGSRRTADRSLGDDYGLKNTGLYPWGTGWTRFGPASNWRCGRMVLEVLAGGGRIDDTVARNAVEGMWFGLGCNPSNVSLVQGLGARDFGDPLLKDAINGPIPGNPSFGPAAGMLRWFEVESIGSAMYPKAQENWPRYAAIFESRRAILCAEHGMRSNAMEWLFACAMVHQAVHL
jgi:Glycosyl hydrolase family 9/Cellulase N-terminal ig-like domain